MSSALTLSFLFPSFPSHAYFLYIVLLLSTVLLSPRDNPLIEEILAPATGSHVLSPVLLLVLSYPPPKRTILNLGNSLFMLQEAMSSVLSSSYLCSFLLTILKLSSFLQQETISSALSSSHPQPPSSRDYPLYITVLEYIVFAPETESHVFSPVLALALSSPPQRTILYLRNNLVPVTGSHFLDPGSVLPSPKDYPILEK
jgi:hypothetical protein